MKGLFDKIRLYFFQNPGIFTFESSNRFSKKRTENIYPDIKDYV